MQPRAADQHDHDQHEANPELPVLRGDGGKHLLQHAEHHRADQPAIEIAGAADHQHQHQIGGALEREHVERGKGRGLGEQRAGYAGIEGGDGVDRNQPPVDGDADRGCAQRVVADRAQRQPERRMHDAPRQQEQEERDDQRIEETDLAENVESEGFQNRLHLDALQAVGAAGDVRETLGERFQQQRDAERHHQACQIGAADHEEAGEETQHSRNQASGDQRQHRLADDAMQGQQPGAIGADAEEGGMPERDDAGIAEDQVERQRKQREPHDVRHDQIARRKDEGAGDDEEPEGELAPMPPRVRNGAAPDVGFRAHQRAAVWPNRPFGRQIRITIITV